VPTKSPRRRATLRDIEQRRPKLAWTAEQLRDRLYDVLAGGILEHLRSVLADRNQLRSLAWRSRHERDRLLGAGLLYALRRPVRTGVDRRRAFEKAVAVVRDREQALARVVEYQVRRDARRELRRGLLAQDFEAYWTEAEMIARFAGVSP
jgi:hypothetical protein